MFKEREREIKSVCREREGVCFEIERWSVCSDREMIFGEIERGSARGEREREVEIECVQNDRNVFMSRDRKRV